MVLALPLCALGVPLQPQHANELSALDDWSTHDLVTLASIVEKEAASSSERARIAGVFWNRLSSKGFLPRKRLQADPTAMVLFIAMNEALCYFIARWICKRVTNSLHRLELLRRTYVLFEPFVAGLRQMTLREGTIRPVPLPAGE